jgi:hypothetical protein
VVIDILILLVVVGAAWIGFQKGLIQPLLTELFALGTLLLIVGHRDGFLAAAQALFHANAILAIFMAIVLAVGMGYLGARLGGAVHKMPAVCGVDGFVGIWMQTLLAVGFCYLLISSLIVMDRAFTPLTTPSVNASELSGLEGQLASNPVTACVVDTAQLQTFESRAAKPGGVRVADLPGVGQLQAIYRDFLQSQLAGSRLAPAVMSIGRHLPGLGQFGPRDVPRRR